MPRPLELLFDNQAEAEAFAVAYLADEEPGCTFEVQPMPNGRQVNLRLFEPNGYLINQEAPPSVVYNAPVRSPRRSSVPHLG